MSGAGWRGATAELRGWWRPRIWTAVVVALALWLGRAPLLGVLGYELAAVMALVAAVMGLDLGSAWARRRQRAQPGAPAPSLVGAAVAAAGLASTVIAAPAVIAAIRGLWAPTCDWGFGVTAYLAMPIATAVLAAPLGYVVGALTGPRRFVAAAAAQLPAIGVALAAVWRVYREPPVRSYNAILGYFPGNLYDENIQLSWPLAWSRLEDLLVIAGVIAAAALRFDRARQRVTWRRPPATDGAARRRWATRACAAVLLAAAAGLHTAGGALGYAVTGADLAAVLDGRVETAHFIIHYARTPEIEADLALIVRDHEFRYAQVVALLGAAPEGKLRSFYFADRDQKARWFGARDVEMAKPWRREIYLEHRAFPHSSLRHEIAHAVASAFGDPVFGAATRYGVLGNPGLIEGLAVAADWPGGYERVTPHEAVRALQELGARIPIRQLFSLEFFAVSSAQGYTTAGSFVRFLLDTHGAAKLRALYRSGGDFDAAYGVPLASLESAWRAMIASIALPPGIIDAQRERFRGGSVFARPCPHAVAARRDRAAAALRANDRASAVALLSEVCDDAPDEPRHWMELADLLGAGSPTERVVAIALWRALAADVTRVTPTLRVELLERLAREAAARGDRAEVEARIAEAASLGLDAHERRQIEAERFALAHRGPAAPALFAYFFAPAPFGPPLLAAWAAMTEPGLGFAHYLLGLQYLARAAWADAAASLDRALALGLPGPSFVRNAARRLALAAYRAPDPTRLAAALEVLARPEMTRGDHLLARDWQERQAFDVTAPR